MLRTKQYNNFPEGYSFPKLAPDEVAVFVCNHNSIGPDGRPIYPTYMISPTATINVDGKIIEIANVIEEAPEGKRPKLDDCIFETGQKGTIVCKGSNARDIRRYQFLMLHPENEANGGGTFRLEKPGQRQKALLEKAKAEAEAINYSLTTPVDVLKSALEERNISIIGKTEDDIRLMAAEEGKRKSFAPAKEVFDARMLSLLNEMVEVGAIVWDASVKQLKNINTGEHYDVQVKHNAKPAEKLKQVIEAAKSRPELAEQLRADAEAYDNPND